MEGLVFVPKGDWRMPSDIVKCSQGIGYGGWSYRCLRPHQSPALCLRPVLSGRNGWLGDGMSQDPGSFNYDLIFFRAQGADDMAYGRWQ
jgi:hypothetical protein